MNMNERKKSFGKEERKNVKGQVKKVVMSDQEKRKLLKSASGSLNLIE